MKKFGDRRDGKRVKNLDVIHKIMPHLMNNRCDAEVYLFEKFDITNLLKYLDEKNDGLEKEQQYTIFMAIITAIFKTIHNRPLLNRFVAGKKFYDRNFITASFVIKKTFEDTAEEALFIYESQKEDNINTIKNRIKKEVADIRQVEQTAIDKTLNFITSGPGLLTNIIVKIIKIMDFYGIVPKSLTQDDPNYSSVLLTNLGSIKCNQVYHHLNNYGTNSLVIAIGTIYENNNRQYVDIGFTADERIADGFYFAKSILLAKKILENPELLEENISTIIKE